MTTITAIFIYLATITFAPNSDAVVNSNTDNTTTESSVVGGDITGMVVGGDITGM